VSAFLRILSLRRFRALRHFSISGCRIVKELGIVRGLTVRTRGIGGRFQAGVSAIVGGKVDAYINMSEQALGGAPAHDRSRSCLGCKRSHWYAIRHHRDSERMDEVLAYGAAVVVEPT
jgi:uncharacterized protein YbjQ (UPF0145 family)